MILELTEKEVVAFRSAMLNYKFDMDCLKSGDPALPYFKEQLAVLEGIGKKMGEATNAV